MLHDFRVQYDGLRCLRALILHDVERERSVNEETFLWVINQVLEYDGVVDSRIKEDVDSHALSLASRSVCVVQCCRDARKLGCLLSH